MAIYVRRPSGDRPMTQKKAQAARAIAQRVSLLLVLTAAVLTVLPVSANAAGPRVDVFAIEAGSVMHRFYDRTTWSGWENLGGTVNPGAGVAAVSWGTNRIDIFVRGTDNALWHKSWNGSSWSGWESLGGTLYGDPGVVSQHPGHLDVYAVGSGGTVYHKWFDNGIWSGWTNIGCCAQSNSAPAPVSWGDNHTDVYIRGTDNAIWHRYWNGSTWSTWASIGGSASGSPSAVSLHPGHLDVYLPGVDGKVHHRWYDNGIWDSQWEDLGGNVDGTTGVGSVAIPPNRIDIVNRSSTGQLMHRFWFGDVWSGWESLASGPISGTPAITTWDKYATSLQYGGTNGAVDSVGELSALLAAMNAASPDGADELSNGLTPDDKEYVAQALRDSPIRLIEQDVPTTLESPVSPTTAELASVGSSDGDEAIASAAGAPAARCRVSNSKQFKLVVDNLPDMGWVSMRTRFCYNPRNHRASWGGQLSTDSHIATGYAVAGWSIDWRDQFVAIHDWNGYSQGQVNMRRDYDIEFCPAYGLVGCTEEERGKIVTFGRYNGSAVAGVYHR
jgi:hypothetical protein